MKASWLGVVALLAGCTANSGDSAGRTLVLGAYTTPREAYGERVLPAFAAQWKAATGEDVRFEQSYQASGAQARAVAGGFEADVVALSLAPDVQRLVDAELVDAQWASGPHAGMVTRSLVVLAVREGNPKQIQGWADLAREDVAVLTPNVRTSGGAMWNVAAIYGAALRGHAGVAAGDEAAAIGLLGRVLKNVRVMDKGARESLLSFEKGIGDVAITYENEVIGAQRAGQAISYVVPASTLQIESPAAVVATYANKHGTADLAEGFVAFLHEEAAQEAFGAYGFRTVAPSSMPAGMPVPQDLFTVGDLGGWAGLQGALFAEGAGYDRALAASRVGHD